MVADYVNNYPNKQKLKINFKREKEGTYLFGTQYVIISDMQNKLQCKIGGGFMSMDVFVDTILPKELEKLQNKDPLRKVTERHVKDDNATITI